MFESALPTMYPVTNVVSTLEGSGFDQVKLIEGSTYRDNSTIIIVPTRGMIHHSVVSAWQNLIAPMNQKRYFWMCVGDEVGVAYNRMVQMILDHPEWSKFKYIMTLEDDNLPPVDAHIRLLESIEETKFDAVSGLYFTKGAWQMPLAFGDPEEFRRTNVLEFRPRDVVKALNHGKVMEVNGIPMGCALYRTDLFREIPAPWFVSVADLTPDGVRAYTQDLFFCERARRSGKRFGVDMRVRVGHLDIDSGMVY